MNIRVIAGEFRRVGCSAGERGPWAKIHAHVAMSVERLDSGQQLMVVPHVDQNLAVILDRMHQYTQRTSGKLLLLLLVWQREAGATETYAHGPPRGVGYAPNATSIHAGRQAIHRSS